MKNFIIISKRKFKLNFYKNIAIKFPTNYKLSLIIYEKIYTERNIENLKEIFCNTNNIIYLLLFVLLLILYKFIIII